MKLESQILSGLIHNDSYSRKILPFIKEEYFENKVEKQVFAVIQEFIVKYNKLPEIDPLIINLEGSRNLPEELFNNCKELITSLSEPNKVNEEWLIDKTEKFCQEKALYNSIMKSIQILDGKVDLDKGAIPSLLTEALGVSFDNKIGHDFMNEFQDRYDFYHKKEERIPFDIEYLNKITKGGLPNKSLNIILAGTGVGKSLAMCHMASANLLKGYNVLYITMEMAEERIAERIDANLLDIKLDDISSLAKQTYFEKFTQLQKKTLGKLIIKEYPTATAGAGHFRHLLNELWLKKEFKPDIIYVDYLNICISLRLKHGANVNSYTYIKSIAEELRGLAVEKNVPIVSATQTTRSGYSNSDPGLEDTSESFGLPATADFFIVLVSNEELEKLNQIMVKQLKNRYSDIVSNKKYILGIDRSKMRLYDVDDAAQLGAGADTPVFDSSSINQSLEETNGFIWKPRGKAR